MMEERLKEKLCLLMDDELEFGESLRLLRRIEDEPELRGLWERYSLARAAMKVHGAAMPASDFVERVRSSIRDEPSILAPRPARPKLQERWVTAAMAAALAIVAVFVVKSFNEFSPMQGRDILALVQSGNAAPAQIDPEFRDYLAEHYQTAYLSGSQGMLPTVRLVSSDSNQ